MKKIFSFIIAFILITTPVLSIAQSVGVTGGALAFFVRNPEAVDDHLSTHRTLGHTSSFTPGFRLEGNAMSIGESPARIGYLGLGVSYFLPHQDSVFYYAKLKSVFNSVPVLSTAKTTCTQLTLHFGYNIPQTANDFLTIHVGVGLGVLFSKTQNLFPEKTSTFNYDQSQFEESTFEPVKDVEVSMDFIAGALYELEKFSVIGQYAFIHNVDKMSGERYRHGLLIGIYYPLKKF
jgi:hypothetical protein